jgi:hypothetical protein
VVDVVGKRDLAQRLAGGQRFKASTPGSFAAAIADPTKCFWYRLPDDCIVEMLFVRPLSDCGDFGIISLYFIVHLVGAESRTYPKGEQRR